MVLSLDEKFTRAVKYIQGLPSDGPYNPSNDEKLGFYALFKQATEGPNKKKKPGMLDLIARAKWYLKLIYFKNIKWDKIIYCGDYFDN